MLVLTFLISLATLSLQAPVEVDSLHGTPNQGTALSRVGIALNATDLTGHFSGDDSNIDFGCYRPFQYPTFRIDDCRIDIANGMSLADLEKPRRWGNIPGGLHTPKEWYSGAPRTSRCKLKIFATETGRTGPKPAEFSFDDIERLEEKIVRACRHYDGGREHTAGGYARMFMATEYGRLRTVYEVALYANTRGPGLLGFANDTAPVEPSIEVAENVTSPIGNATPLTGNASSPTANSTLPSSDEVASA